jgi:uncharacterized protein (TIRG00374 family)
VLRGTDLDRVGHQLAAASIAGILLSAAINLAHNVFRVWRWGVLLRPVRAAIPFRPMFDAVILGYMTSWIIPGRLGELVRPALLSGREGVPLGPCLGSVVADRLLDGAAVVALFGIGIATTPLAGEAAEHAAVIRAGALVMVVALFALLAILLVAGRARHRIEPWLAGRGRAIAWVGRMLLSFARGTESLARPRLLALALVHTALAWATIVFALWIGLAACGVDLSLPAVGVLLPVLVLGIALPTPGGAGGYHAAMTFGLTRLFAVDEAVAVGASILIHLATIVPVCVVGAVLLAVDRLPLRDLVDAARQVRELGAAPEGRP